MVGIQLMQPRGTHDDVEIRSCQWLKGCCVAIVNETKTASLAQQDIVWMLCMLVGKPDCELSLRELYFAIQLLAPLSFDTA